MVRKQQKYSKLNDNIKYHLTSLNDYFMFLIHMYGMHTKRKQTLRSQSQMSHDQFICQL